MDCSATTAAWTGHVLQCCLCQEWSAQTYSDSRCARHQTDLHRLTELSPKIQWMCSWREKCLLTWPSALFSRSMFGPPFRNPLTSLEQCDCIFQGRWILVLCGAQSLHRLNWRHCNYSAPLILHFFQQGYRCCHYPIVEPTFRQKIPSVEWHFYRIPQCEGSRKYQLPIQ